MSKHFVPHIIEACGVWAVAKEHYLESGFCRLKQYQQKSSVFLARSVSAIFEAQSV